MTMDIRALTPPANALCQDRWATGQMAGWPDGQPGQWATKRKKRFPLVGCQYFHRSLQLIRRQKRNNTLRGRCFGFGPYLQPPALRPRGPPQPSDTGWRRLPVASGHSP